MQVTCFAVDWVQVANRPSAQRVADEMLLTDDVDLYAKPVSTECWRSDSAIQFSETAQNLKEVLARVDQKTKSRLEVVAQLVSTGNSIDEIGLAAVTGGCYFASLSPERVRQVLDAFQAVDLESIKGLNSVSKDWLLQWKCALEYANSLGYGIIGHCG